MAAPAVVAPRSGDQDLAGTKKCSLGWRRPRGDTSSYRQGTGHRNEVQLQRVQPCGYLRLLSLRLLRQLMVHNRLDESSPREPYGHAAAQRPGAGEVVEKAA